MLQTKGKITEYGQSKTAPGIRKRSLILCQIRELSFFHSLLELINTSACINELLLACIERVAVGADIYSQVALCGKSLECVAACALNCDELRLRMNSFFHVTFHLSIKDMTRNLNITYVIPDSSC